MLSCPEIGQLVVVRKRPFVVMEIVPAAVNSAMETKVRSHLVKLSSVEDDGLGEELEVLWELEPGTSIHERSTLPEPRTFGDPKRLQAFLDAVRWGAISQSDDRALHSPFRSGIEIDAYQLDPVVRALSMPRVAEAWENLEKEHPGEVLITPEGGFSQGEPSERLIPKEASERLAIARRLVADRCLYGVDINPMAVEMAKLSIWLITVDKSRPFTFLDHALKCGDSLLGVSSVKQIAEFSLRRGERQVTFATANLVRYVDEASAKRRELENVPSNDQVQIETKNRLHVEAEAATAKVKALGDALIAFELRGLDGKNYEDQRTAAAAEAEVAMAKPLLEFQRYAAGKVNANRTFHWPVEIPEVFARGGFNALVGNPPFMGGLKLETAFGTQWRAYLVEHLAEGLRGVRGTADLCVYFILRALQLTLDGGVMGFLATNTVSEGDSRVVGLDRLIEKGFTLYRAVRSCKWPGTASLEISQLWLRRGLWGGPCILDEQSVGRITSQFTEQGAVVGTPYPLSSNAGIAFQGSIVLGKGLVLDFSEGEQLRQNAKNRDVVLPYMNGDDLHTRFDQSPSRWVINFMDWPLNRETAPNGYVGPVAADYPDCLAIVEERTKPERMEYELINAWNRKVRTYWWHFGQYRWALDKAMDGAKRVLLACRVTKYLAHSLVPTGPVFDEALYVIVASEGPLLAILESGVYEAWVRSYGSSLETRLRYTLKTCFETFPFPANKTTDGLLGSLGDSFHKLRRSIMAARKEGITETYNRFHDPTEKSADIGQLRAFHVEMDQAVASAYGWGDLDLRHDYQETKQGVRYTFNEVARRGVACRDYRGEKKIEYREVKPYWTKPLKNINVPFQLRLLNGMNPPVPESYGDSQGHDESVD